MDFDGARDFSPVYSVWYGIPVLLFVIRQCQVPIPCNIVGESIGAVRIELQPGWKMDVQKEFILAVEEATNAQHPCMN